MKRRYEILARQVAITVPWTEPTVTCGERLTDPVDKVEWICSLHAFHPDMHKAIYSPDGLDLDVIGLCWRELPMIVEVG